MEGRKQGSAPLGQRPTSAFPLQRVDAAKKRFRRLLERALKGARAQGLRAAHDQMDDPRTRPRPNDDDVTPAHIFGRATTHEDRVTAAQKRKHRASKDGQPSGGAQGFAREALRSV